LKKLGLLPKLILAIVAGIVIGNFSPESLIRIFSTFNHLFSQFLGYMIPFIIIGFVATGIAELGSGAGKLLGITVFIAYLSTITAGLFAYTVNSIALPNLLQIATELSSDNPEQFLVDGYIPLFIPPVMGVMTALVTAFFLGLGMAGLKSDSLIKVISEFHSIVVKTIVMIIIPLLPFHIFGIFANMSYSGAVIEIMSTFGVVFVIAILIQLVFILFQYFVAGSMSHKNPINLLKTMLPAYFTAIGTQSSAASIPVTLAQTKKNKVTDSIAEFVVPLCATIHLSGSTITIVSCSIAVSMMLGNEVSLTTFFPFILMLGVTMIAAPGIPGGSIMASLGILESMLGFDPSMLSLMIALYIAQDSFGTACNITGDGAIAVVVDTLFNKNKKDKKQTA
jgi:Na+/H+-dicarboxylate symporter